VLVSEHSFSAAPYITVINNGLRLVLNQGITESSRTYPYPLYWLNLSDFQRTYFCCSDRRKHFRSSRNGQLSPAFAQRAPSKNQSWSLALHSSLEKEIWQQTLPVRLHEVLSSDECAFHILRNLTREWHISVGIALVTWFFLYILTRNITAATELNKFPMQNSTKRIFKSCINPRYPFHIHRRKMEAGRPNEVAS